MSEDRLGAPNEKMRLCPSCRMSIPVLAVKCRFCGEEVGRPRDESRRLSVSDLGGQDATVYAPSSSVMEALEAFRAQEFNSSPPEEPHKRKRFGKKKVPAEEPKERQPGDLPELDERSRALASLSMPARPVSKPYAQQEPTWIKKVGFLGAFIAAILIMYFGGVRVVAVINEWRKPPPVALKANHALDLIKQAKAGNTLKYGDALAEAVKLYSEQPTPANAAILKKVRPDTLQEVRSLLDAQNWTMADLDKASGIMARANKDSNSAFRKLQSEVYEELTSYKSILSGADMKNDTATFKVKHIGQGGVPGASNDTVKVKLNHKITGTQFQVVKIISAKAVRVEDLKHHRFLTFTAGNPLEGADS